MVKSKKIVVKSLRINGHYVRRICISCFGCKKNFRRMLSEVSAVYTYLQNKYGRLVKMDGAKMYNGVLIALVSKQSDVRVKDYVRMQRALYIKGADKTKTILRIVRMYMPYTKQTKSSKTYFH